MAASNIIEEDIEMASEKNPLGLLGIEFTEFATPDSDFMHQVFIDFGFSMLKKAKDREISITSRTTLTFCSTRSVKASAPNLPSAMARPSAPWGGG